MRFGHSAQNYNTRNAGADNVARELATLNLRRLFLTALDPSPFFPNLHRNVGDDLHGLHDGVYIGVGFDRLDVPAVVNVKSAIGRLVENSSEVISRSVVYGFA